MTWTVAASAISTAFLSSLVEAVEALTIVLAVGTVRGWRPAGLGALVGLVLLALIVLALGPLLDRVPLHLLQLTIGVLLLLFGMRWLRKAILRAAGSLALCLHAFTRLPTIKPTSTRRRDFVDGNHQRAHSVNGPTRRVGEATGRELAVMNFCGAFPTAPQSHCPTVDQA